MTTNIENLSSNNTSNSTNHIELDDSHETIPESIIINTNCSKRRSVVWNHFEIIDINGSKKAKCKYCSKLLGGESKNETRHLHDHFNRCLKVPKCLGLRQQVLTNTLSKDGKQSIGNYMFDQDSVRREFANMIIMHEYPLSMEDHFGFRKLLGLLQPLFKVPSRNTLRSDILQICEYEKTKIMSMIDKNASRIAITSDMWTASNQKKGYMVVTAHFIDHTWTLQNRILRFIYVPCPHTKENLSQVLLSCLMDWNIDTKLSTITLDNCSTNDALMKDIIEKLQRNKLMLSGTLLHMRCCAHILNLIVKDGLDIIKDGIEKVRDSVSYWTATPKREENFEEIARQCRIVYAKKLVLDCPTRWNSIFLMLETALVYKDVFIRAEQRESQYKSIPSSEEWEFADEICKNLKSFYNVTQLFSGIKYPTANMLFPKICDIYMKLSSWINSSNWVISQMAANMNVKFKKYWDDIHGLMGVAIVLDPRYKLDLLEFYFPKIYEDSFLSKIEEVRQLCYNFLEEYHHKSDFDKRCGEGSTCSNSANSDADNTLSDLQKFMKRKRSNTLHVKSELDGYLEEDTIDCGEDFDILIWWKMNACKYPLLQIIAKAILAIPVSTIASESAFSASGRVLSSHRSRLTPTILQALMCTRNWLCEFENIDVHDEDAEVVDEEKECDIMD